MQHWLIDLDDVICELTPTLVECLNARFKKNLEPDQIVTYDLSELYDCSFADVFECLQEDIDWLNLPVKTGAIEGLQILKDEIGAEIHICTARWFLDKSLTREYLEKIQVPFDDLMITSSGNPKSESYSAKSLKYEAMVDDHYLNLVDAVQSGLVKERYLINMPHNWSQSIFFRNGETLQECVLKHLI